MRSKTPRPSTPRWTAQPGPQARFVAAPEFEVIYGGARGGGKTDAALGDFARHARRWRGAAQGLMVRRTRSSLEPTIGRAREIYAREGATWVQSRGCFEWPSGARLAMRHMANDHDAALYQGHGYSRVYVEELTQFPRSDAVDKLKATLRSAAGAPCAFRATCNPGGPGHAWVKQRYIDAGDARVVEAIKNPRGGEDLQTQRLFIPAKLDDNPALIGQDPDYAARLAKSGSELLVRAWLDGDWSVIMGAFFDGWSARNIIKPFRIPEDWTRFIAFDWGLSAPFSVGWWAVVSETISLPTYRLPRGALVRYREWYGVGPDGKGLRLTASQVAQGILQRQIGEPKPHGVADPSIFNQQQGTGPTINEVMRQAGITFRPADNTRVGKLGAVSGWNEMRERILGNEEGPMLVVFDTCRDFIRTVPVQQHDPMRPEDLDTTGEDHIADETRYACMSRPLIARPQGAGPDPLRAPEDYGRGSFRGWSGFEGQSFTR
jgi:hypothetical protein